jgi:hypothetical protein
MQTAHGGSCWLLHAACLLSGLIADTVDHGMHVLIIAPAPRKPTKVWRCCAVICMIYHSSDVALYTGGISRAPTQLTFKLGYLSVVCQAANSEPCPVSTASCSICRCPSSVLGHFKSNQKEVPSDCPWELLGAMRCSQHHACMHMRRGGTAEPPDILQVWEPVHFRGWGELWDGAALSTLHMCTAVQVQLHLHANEFPDTPSCGPTPKEPPDKPNACGN